MLVRILHVSQLELAYCLSIIHHVFKQNVCALGEDSLCTTINLCHSEDGRDAGILAVDLLHAANHLQHHYGMTTRQSIANARSSEG